MQQYIEGNNDDREFKKYLNNEFNDDDSELDEKEKEDEILVNTDEQEFFYTI